MKSIPINLLTMSPIILAWMFNEPVEKIEYYQELAAKGGIDPDYAAQQMEEAKYCQ